MAFNPLLCTENFTYQDGFQTTLSDAMTDSQTTCSLTVLPTGTEGTLVVEPGTTNEEEIYYTSKGTGVVNIPSASAGRGVNGTAKAHNSGVPVKMLFTKASIDALKYAGGFSAKKKAGWDFLIASGTRTGDTTFTVTGDVTDKIAVGDKLEITDTTTKYFYVVGVSFSSVTTITVTGGTDYTLTGNPSNIYYSHGNAVGHPDVFAYTPTLARVSGAGTQLVTSGTTNFSIKGKNLKIWGMIRNDNNDGSARHIITVTTPITISGQIKGGAGTDSGSAVLATTLNDSSGKIQITYHTTGSGAWFTGYFAECII